MNELVKSVFKKTDESGEAFDMTAYLMALGSLVLGFIPPLAIFGVVLAIVALIVRYKKKKQGAYLKAPKATMALAVAALLIGASVNSAYVEEGAASKVQDESESIEQVVETEEGGTLCFEVVVEASEEPLTDPVVILVTGATKDGEAVSAKYEAVPNTLYDLPYGAGSYQFEIDNTVFNGSYVTVSAVESCDFDGVDDYVVRIETRIDSETTEKAFEEKKAEEDAAKKKAEEEAAAAAAAATATAAGSAASGSSESGSSKSSSGTNGSSASGSSSESSSSSSSSSNEQMVWIPNSGKKYHSHSGCSGMNNPTQVTISKAESLGYTPCKKCY